MKPLREFIEEACEAHGITTEQLAFDVRRDPSIRDQVDAARYQIVFSQCVYPTHQMAKEIGITPCILRNSIKAHSVRVNGEFPNLPLRRRLEQALAMNPRPEWVYAASVRTASYARGLRIPIKAPKEQRVSGATKEARRAIERIQSRAAGHKFPPIPVRHNPVHSVAPKHWLERQFNECAYLIDDGGTACCNPVGDGENIRSRYCPEHYEFMTDKALTEMMKLSTRERVWMRQRTAAARSSDERIAELDEAIV